MVNCEEVPKKYMGELMEHKGFFHRFVLAFTPSVDKKVLVQVGLVSEGKFYDLLLGRKREIKEPFLHVLFLKSSQLESVRILQLNSCE